MSHIDDDAHSTDESIDDKSIDDDKSVEEDEQNSQITIITPQEREDLTIYDVFSRFPVNNGWKQILTKYDKQIKGISGAIYAKCGTVHLPEPLDVFNAFVYTPYEKLRVVIIGQDPYPTPGDAMGLAFSVRKESRIPPSLKNIFTEIHNEYGFKPPSHGSLIKWALQGVLLLNTCLTVEPGKAGIHSHPVNLWAMFTYSLIETICKEKKGLIFLLWGAQAQKMKEYIGRNQIMLCCAHPSPRSVTEFYGCNHFKETNDILTERGDTPIDWSIDE